MLYLSYDEVVTEKGRERAYTLKDGGRKGGDLSPMVS